MAMANHARRHALEYYAARSDHTAITYFYARCNKAIRCDPGVITDTNRCSTDAEGSIIRIVISGAEMAALGNHAVASYGDRRQVVEAYAITDPHMIARLKAPGEGEANARANANIRAEFGAKALPPPCTPAECHLGAGYNQ